MRQIRILPTPKKIRWKKLLNILPLLLGRTATAAARTRFIWMQIIRHNNNKEKEIPPRLLPWLWVFHNTIMHPMPFLWKRKNQSPAGILLHNNNNNAILHDHHHPNAVPDALRTIC